MTRHQQKLDFRTPFGVVFQEKKNHRSEIITVKELNFKNKLDLEQYRKFSIFGKIFAFAWKNTRHTYISNGFEIVHTNRVLKNTSV
jgi:hypothetical protein